jgi:hypothetical protein
VIANLLSASPHLTRLQLSEVVVEPGALAGKQQLQHLEICMCDIEGDAAGALRCWTFVQQMLQLTYVEISCSVKDVTEDEPPSSSICSPDRQQS